MKQQAHWVKVNAFYYCEAAGLYIKAGNDDLMKSIYFLLLHMMVMASIPCSAFTPVRIVCANTLNAALRNYSNSIKIRHTANAKQRLEQAHKVMGI